MQTSTKQEGGSEVEWDEEFKFTELEQPSSYKLELHVYDEDTYTRDDTLGYYTLHLGTLESFPGFVDHNVSLAGKTASFLTRREGQARLRFAVNNFGQWGHSNNTGGQ